MSVAKKSTSKKKFNQKKTAPKRLKSSKQVEAESMMMEVETATIDTASVKKMSAKVKAAILAALIVIGVVLYLSRGILLAASVNGEFIYRPTVISELEKRGGKQQLDALVTELIIEQESKKNNIVISDDEVNAEITKITESVKAQGQDINTLLTMQGMTQDDLKKQVRTQKLVEKLLAEKVNPTDQEVQDFIKSNKETLPKGQTDDQLKATAKQQVMQQKLSAEFQIWLAEVKKNASIKYFTNY